MPDSASANDLDYLLRHLGITTCRFSVKNASLSHLQGLDADMVRYVEAHPGTTVIDFKDNMPTLVDWTYGEARDALARLVDRGVLEICGFAPLEAVDPVYERVSRCAVCGSDSSAHTTRFYKYNTPVVRCSRCGLLYSNPRWKTEHLVKRYAGAYWDTYNHRMQMVSPDLAANQVRYDPYLHDLEPARQNNRLLDVGCATGEFLAAARARGWEVFGVETAHEGAAQAHTLTGAQVHVGGLDTAPFEPGYFDVVTLWDVIEHLQDPADYIARIARLVRPGGMLGLSTPNIRSLSYVLLGRHWWVVGPNDHLYYFAPRTLARLLRSHGFSIHAMRSTGTQPDTFERWLRYPPLKRFAPPLARVLQPFIARRLWGDQLYVIARRTA